MSSVHSCLNSPSHHRPSGRAPVTDLSKCPPFPGWFRWKPTYERCKCRLSSFKSLWKSGKSSHLLYISFFHAFGRILLRASITKSRARQIHQPAYNRRPSEFHGGFNSPVRSDHWVMRIYRFAQALSLIHQIVAARMELVMLLPTNSKRKVDFHSQVIYVLRSNTASGYTVIATVLEHEDRSHLTAAGIHAFSADVTKDQDIMNLRKDVTATTGDTLDVLVNNA